MSVGGQGSAFGHLGVPLGRASGGGGGPGYDVVLLVSDSYGVGIQNRDAGDTIWPGFYQYGSYPSGSDYRTIEQVIPLPQYGTNAFAVPNPLSYAEYFGKSYAARTGRNVLLVPMGYNGSSIGTSGHIWQVGDSAHEAAIAQANLAITAAQAQFPNSRFVGILHWRGANDAMGDVPGATFKALEVAALQDMRARITGATNSWVIYGGMLPEFLAGDHTNRDPIEQALQQIAAEQPNAKYVPMPAGHNSGDFLHSDNAGNRLMGGLNDAILTDTTAPVLTSQSAASTGPTVATLSVTTDSAGMLFCVVSTSATVPTVAQMIAGKDAPGNAAVFASEQYVSAAGAASSAATGMTASTAYHAFFMQKDNAGNVSAVATASFTTQDQPTTQPITITYSGTDGGPGLDNTADGGTTFRYSINLASAPDASRGVIIGAGGFCFGNTVSAKLNGTAMRQIAFQRGDGGGITQSNLFLLECPTGTTATIELDFTGGCYNPIIGAWTVTGADLTNPIVASTAGDGAAAHDNTILTLSVPVNGGLVGFSYCNGTDLTDWTGATQDFHTNESSAGGGDCCAIGCHSNIPAGGSTTISNYSPGNGLHSAVGAAFAPIGA